MKNTKALIHHALQLIKEKKDFVFATVIASHGSAPRGAGSRMLVTADGSSFGTVGGGNVEFEAIRQSQEQIKKQCSCKVDYTLRPNDAADLGMVCGGDVTVYFQYVSCEDQSFITLCHEVVEAFKQHHDTWIVLDITDEAHWTASLAYASDDLIYPDSPQISTVNGHLYYSEPLTGGRTVYIFGGGHVALELVPLLSYLDFRCVVYDDREDFCNPDRFPSADRCITADFKKITEHLTITDRDYVCIMSRGHQYDYEIQKQILRTPASYIGVIGSRRKKEAIHKKLLADGFTQEDLSRIITPIGLNIFAETPAEIAVSIAGQMIMYRAGHSIEATSSYSF